MSTMQFQSSPEAVLEIVDDRHAAYWLRSENGNYQRIRLRDFPLHAKARVGTRKLEAFICDAMENRARIRSIAGLDPGLYRDGFNVFLNPDFVSMEKPEQLPNPPADFEKLFLRRGELMDAGQKFYSNEIRQLEKQLFQMFVELRQLKKAVKKHHHPWRVLNLPYSPIHFPSDDHCHLFESGTGSIWTSQPYGYDAAALLGFAHLHGLSVTVSPKWSWYFPGKSVLIEWTRDYTKRSLLN